LLLFYYFFDNEGLYVWTAIANILSNIEVLIIVKAFGLRQTLGNVFFATTFLATDILSETTGKKSAQRAVNLGLLTSISFILVAQSWLFYNPDSSDFAMPSIKTIFSNTPRLVFASLLVYLISQKFDVWAYHKIWDITTKISGDSKKYLWLRNNGSTLTSQFINTVLYAFFAFWGTFEFNVLLEIIISSYIVFVFTSLLDTPVVYLARKIYFLKQKNNK
jgi:hypothetical protein